MAGRQLASFSPQMAVLWARPRGQPKRASLSPPRPYEPPGARRLVDAPRTLTIRRRGEARQAKKEQRRRPEPGAGAGSLGSHGAGVRGPAAGARAPTALDPAARAAARRAPLGSARCAVFARRRLSPAHAERGERGGPGRLGTPEPQRGGPNSRGSRPRRRGGGGSPAPPSRWAPGGLGAKGGCAGRTAGSQGASRTKGKGLRGRETGAPASGNPRLPGDPLRKGDAVLRGLAPPGGAGKIGCLTLSSAS